MIDRDLWSGCTYGIRTEDFKPKKEEYPKVTLKTCGDLFEDRISKWLNETYTQEWKASPFTYDPKVTDYIINDIELTKSLSKQVKEIEMNKRNMMNQLRKDMYVEIYPSMVKGDIVAFDYAHLRVGIRPENNPSYTGGTILWVDPDNVTVVKRPAPKPTYKYPKPRRVINDPEAGVTVVLWDDGEKTIVRAAKDEQVDVYDAFCAAFCKRVYGTNSALKRELGKVLEVKGSKKKEEPATFGVDIISKLEKLSEDVVKTAIKVDKLVRGNADET